MHVYQPTDHPCPHLAADRSALDADLPRIPDRRFHRRDRRTNRRRRTRRRRRGDHRRHPRVRTMARHAPRRSTGAAVDRGHCGRARGRTRSRRPRGELRHQHERTRRPRRDLWRRHRRGTSRRPAPFARTDRAGLATPSSPRCGRSAGSSPHPAGSTSSRSTPSSARAGRSSSPPAHRCWRSRLPTVRERGS